MYLDLGIVRCTGKDRNNFLQCTHQSEMHFPTNLHCECITVNTFEISCQKTLCIEHLTHKDLGQPTSP